MPKISFVCPIFNKEKYLTYVLDSIKKQKGEFEKEYIFINDGSKDASLSILKEKTSKWKNVMYYMRKKGVIYTINSLGSRNYKY